MSESRIKFTLTADISKFVRSMEKAAKSAHQLSLAFMSKRTKRRHLRRCYLCSPMANPKPLSIDGHAYRNRRKRR